WRSRSASAVDGIARAALTWGDNNGQAWISVGTHTNLYAMTRGGALSDITPTGFVPGSENAVAGGGYGTGLYGTSLYGTPRPDGTNIIPASSWSLDTFGENLVAVMDSDTKLYEWTLDPLVEAAPIANAPDAVALVTTQEGILMALGADDGGGIN